MLAKSPLLVAHSRRFLCRFVFRMCSSFHVLKMVCALVFLGKSTADASPLINPPTSSVGSTPVVPGAFDTPFMEFVEEARHGRQLQTCVSVQL